MVNGVKTEDGGVKKEKPAENLPWGCCIADMDTCPVHSTIYPRTNWAYFSKVEELDALIDSLNPRGIYESELKERLLADRESLLKKFKKFNNVLDDQLVRKRRVYVQILLDP